MRRALLAVLMFASVVALGWPAGPLQQDPDFIQDVQAGSCTRRLVRYTAFLPVPVQVALADAGFPITPTLQPYKRLVGRAWRCVFSDGGTLFIPPRLSRFGEYFRHDLTTVDSPGCFTDGGTLCPSLASERGDDNGLPDPFLEVPFECACSTGASCTVGGNAAPTGVTLSPGTFSGAGCRRKACGGLFLQGGADTTWPAVCPTP